MVEPFFNKNLSFEHYLLLDEFDQEQGIYNIIKNSFNENNDISTSSESNLIIPNDKYIIMNDSTTPPNILNNELNSTKTLFGLKKRKKPGRSRNIEDSPDKKPYIHTKNKFDNILTKLQVSYVNFLVYLTNIILRAYGRKDLIFRLIDSKIKKNNKIENRKKLKEQTIGDILKNKISRKYTTCDKNANFETYKKIENDGLIDILNVLNQKFLFFFENVYFKSLRKFNLNQFGLMNLEIEIPYDIELYENLLLKNKHDPKFEQYKLKMEKCVLRHFLGGLEEEELKKKIIL